MHRLPGLFVLSLSAVACLPGPRDGSGGDPPGNVDAGVTPTEGVPLLSDGEKDASLLTIEEVASHSDGLRLPRDLDFNPSAPGELWIVNREDDGVVTVYDVGTPTQRAIHRIDGYAMHFMEETSSISFGAPGTFGTCGESRNTYNDQQPGNDFMGPALWSSDPEIFAVENPIDLGSHLDMLHESPLCMGIAWEKENVYWVFDGKDGAIVRYDFGADHGPGYDDHSDGIIHRYDSRVVKRFPNVPSHLALDHATGLLYVADTGNARIAVLDTTTGSPGAQLSVIERGTLHQRIEGAAFGTLVDSTTATLIRPSGLALRDGLVYVADNMNGRISAFTTGGGLVGYVDLGLAEGSLMGITFDADGNLYFVDALEDRVMRIVRPQP